MPTFPNPSLVRKVIQFIPKFEFYYYEWIFDILKTWLFL